MRRNGASITSAAWIRQDRRHLEILPKGKLATALPLSVERRAGARRGCVSSDVGGPSNNQGRQQHSVVKRHFAEGRSVPLR